MEKHFCTCEDLTCKFNPHNGVANCDLCIKKNLAKREIPSCFFRKISNDLSNQNDFSFEAFSELLKQNS